MSAAANASHTLQLRIVDLSTGQLKVALTLPISLISTAQRLGALLLPPNTTIDSLVRQAEADGVANLIWTDEQNDERLELTVE